MSATPGTPATLTSVKVTLAKSMQSLKNSLKLEGFGGFADPSYDIVPKGSDRYEGAIKKPSVPSLRLGSNELQSQELSIRSDICFKVDDIKRQLEAEQRRSRGLELTVTNLKEELRDVERSRADCQAQNLRLRQKYNELELERDLSLDTSYSFSKEKAFIEQQVFEVETLRSKLISEQTKVTELEHKVSVLETKNLDLMEKRDLGAREHLDENFRLKSTVELKDREIAIMQRRLDSIENKSAQHDNRFFEISRVSAEKQYLADKLKTELDDFKAKYAQLQQDKENDEKRLKTDLEAQRRFCMQLSVKLKESQSSGERGRVLQEKLKEVTLKCEKFEFLYDEQLNVNKLQQEDRENRTRKPTQYRESSRTPLRARPRTVLRKRKCSADFDQSINGDGFSELIKDSQRQLGLAVPLKDSRCNSCLKMMNRRS
jgi:hypothetical protein